MVYKNLVFLNFTSRYCWLLKIGIFWFVNSLAPSQEHFLSELVKQKIGAAADSASIDEIKESCLIFTRK